MSYVSQFAIQYHVAPTIVVPEPPTWLSLATGVAVLGLLSRGQRRAMRGAEGGRGAG